MQPGLEDGKATKQALTSGTRHIRMIRHSFLSRSTQVQLPKVVPRQQRLLWQQIRTWMHSSRQAAAAIAAVERAGKTQDIDIVSTDFLPDLGDRLENGSMAGESGGHYCDPLIAFMMVYNAIKGNYTGFAGNFEDVSFPYLYVSSAEDYQAYEKYFVDQLPYTSDELVEMSNLDLSALKEAAKNISIEDAASRAGN